MKLLLVFLSVLCTSVSPLKMGILEAETDEQRYEILYEAHKKALERGVKVDYSGIDTLRLTIGKSAKSIPLGDFDLNGKKLTLYRGSKSKVL